MDKNFNKAVESNAIDIKANVEHSHIRINKWRVREGFSVNNSQIILLYEAVDVDGKLLESTIFKLKSHCAGVVKKRFFENGEIVQKGMTILEMSACAHTTIIKDMCADCGADLRQNQNGQTSEASVPMVHSIPDLKVSQKIAQKLGRDDTRRLLTDRKLVLLVDLDQTLIHTTNDNVPNQIKNIYHFQLYGPHSPWYHTRLRPRTNEFLKSMSKFYELHICTFGARNYAHTIAQILDPDGKFFSNRILSRDECFNATSKTDNLRALFPNGDTMVCIIDDREDVWNMAPNLIQVKPYHFFSNTGDINAPPGMSKHELDGEGVDFKDLETISNNCEELSKRSTEFEIDNSSSDEEVDCFSADHKSNDLKYSFENTKDNYPSTSNTIKVMMPESGVSVSLKNKKIETMVKEEMKCSINKTSIDKKMISNIDEKTNVQLDVELDMFNRDVQEVNKNKKVILTKGLQNEKQINESHPEFEKSDKKISMDKTNKISNKLNIKKLEQEIDGIECSTNTLNSDGKPNDLSKQYDVKDTDDYLYYLEDILKKIHERFYNIYDKRNEIPDLKILVPKIRSEVLRNTSLVFSGLVPNHLKLDQTRAYAIAKSLGAEVCLNVNPKTTHLVAASSGTFKVNTAKSSPKIKIVQSSWLWNCAERWEQVEEQLYPLEKKGNGKQRQPPAHCHSPEHVVNYSDKSEISSSSSAQKRMLNEPEKFMNTINPLLSFSNADLDDMNNDFDEFFDSETSSDDEPTNFENPPVNKLLRKRKREEKKEERTRTFFSCTAKEGTTEEIPTNNKEKLGGKIDTGMEILDDEAILENEQNEDVDDVDDIDDDEMPSTKFRRGEDLPSDFEIDSDDSNKSQKNESDDDDGTWNLMGAALEREFLGLED